MFTINKQAISGILKNIDQIYIYIRRYIYIKKIKFYCVITKFSKNSNGIKK